MVARRGDAPAKKSDGGAARGCASEKWAMGCASLDRQRWRSEGMRRPKWAMVVRRGDAPAKWSNTKSVGWRQMRRQMKRPNWRGMCRPSETTPNRWRLGGECAGQMKQHQIGGGSVGNAPAKWNNTKLVAFRQGMRRPNITTPNWWRLSGECAGQMDEQQIGGGSAGNAPAKWNNTKSVAFWRGMRRPTNRTTPNRWRLGGECAGQMDQHQVGGSAGNALANE